MVDMAAKIAAAAATGDVQALATLAIELAQENSRLAGHAAALEEAEAARRAKQNARTRKHRNVTERDVTLHSVTERDVTLRNGTPPSPPSPSLLPPEPPNNSSPTPSSPGMRTIALRPPGPATDVTAVLEHFRTRHPRRRPGSKEAKIVAKALSWGYSAAELCEAIDGNADDPWHAERGKHDLGYVFRDSGHIDDARAKLAAAEKPVEIRDGWFADVGA